MGFFKSSFFPVLKCADARPMGRLQNGAQGASLVAGSLNVFALGALDLSLGLH